VSESRKSLKIQKTYEALFALEDIREISNSITRIKSIISDLEKGEGKYGYSTCDHWEF
jgi:hypothetical protein